ncbi:hypothetical protein [Tomitella gaofuii]|uniref:hypothetical protein n=1 Tax=Tomitella gaofuii TaxID=2760083 RepID=UPI0020BF7B58|nr:hypothetical protein [Tomitella gaofuii]
MDIQEAVIDPDNDVAILACASGGDEFDFGEVPGNCGAGDGALDAEEVMDPFIDPFPG